MQTLKFGSKGEEVKKLQSYLNLCVDGIFGKMTEEEDKELIFYTNLYKERCWEEISKHFPNKTGLQCFSRFNRIRPGLSRGKWTKEEDDKIIELVRLYGRDWSIIARMSKQMFPRKVMRSARRE